MLGILQVLQDRFPRLADTIWCYRPTSVGSIPCNYPHASFALIVAVTEILPALL